MKILKGPTDEETFEAFDELENVYEILEVCHQHQYFDKKVLKYLIDHQLLNTLSLNNLLLIASGFGDLNTIKYALSLGADPNYEFDVDPKNIVCKNGNGYERYWLYRSLNSLGYAVRNNHLECAKFLAQRGAVASIEFLDFVRFVDVKMVRFMVEDLKLDVNNYDGGVSCYYRVASEYLKQTDNNTIMKVFNYLKSKNAKMYFSSTYMEQSKDIADYFNIPVNIIHSKTNDYGTYYDTKIVIRPTGYYNN